MNLPTKPYVVLICGDRNWTDKACIDRIVHNLPTGTIIVHGDAPGADTLAGESGRERGLEVKPIHAEWGRYGRAAGPIRNKQMLREENPNIVYAFHNDLSRSKGTANMIKLAKEAGVPVRVIRSG